MRKIAEVLRLSALGLSRRQVARSVGVAPGTVTNYLSRAQAAGIAWPLREGLDEGALEAALFCTPSLPAHEPSRPLPDWELVHAELARKHVTLRLLWEEYKAEHPEGYQYSQFCERYRRWARKLSVWMRQEHRGGEKLFVDFSGDGIPWLDPESGERREAELFVAALGASQLIYAEATATQQLQDWIGAQVRAFGFYGGVSELLVPDQTRTAVRSPCRYDPELNPSYGEFARHYSTCVMPARPRRPRDKAKAESAVLIAQRWIIARLRNRTFYSLEEVNHAVAECVEKINDRPLRHLGVSRRELFEKLDKPALKPLPSSAFEYAQWQIGVRVDLGYHLEWELHRYSVPYRYALEKVDVRATAATIEVFYNHERIASHVRSYERGGVTTLREHMPSAHRRHAERSPADLLEEAARVGGATRELLEAILKERPHPEQGYRASVGILRLGRRHGQERLEAACRRALLCGAHRYQFVESILRHRLESEPLPKSPGESLPVHENLRGSQYYN
jgi:transposase